jgi:hypothetical protein
MRTTDLCHRIRSEHRKRQFLMDQRKRFGNALGAFLRRSQGWSKTLPEAERKRIETSVAAALAAGEALVNKKMESDLPLFVEYRDLIVESIHGRAPYERLEHDALLEMNRLVRRLPVWSAWAKGITGLGEASLGTIIGEAGDLSNYDSYSQLWKRMGLAVMDGTRQGGLKSTASADLWVKHGYSGRRRSFLFVIGDVMIRFKDGPYRAVYDTAKLYETSKAIALGKTVEPASKRTKDQPDKFMSIGHIHTRAKRKMEKQLLRDLWQHWNAAEQAAGAARPDLPRGQGSHAASIEPSQVSA